MIGYVKAYKPELKIKDFEIYKGIYCSLCKQLGKSYTPFAQLLLNYDFVFLLLLKLSLSSNCPEIKIKRCQYNPFIKCRCLNASDFIEKYADLIVIISYYKVKDDMFDKKGLKKISTVLILPFLSFIHLRAKKRSPDFEDTVAAAIAEQKLVETTIHPCIDQAAEPTAKALSELFAIGENDEVQRKILKRLGYMLGRWAYIIDAADDLDEDIKNDAFNPFSVQYPKCKTRDELEKFADYVSQVLMTTSGEASLAFELLETKRYRNIMENILYDGLINSAEIVMKKYRRCALEKPV